MGRRGAAAAILGILAACASAPPPHAPTAPAAAAPIVRAAAVWQPVPWRDLPGWNDERAGEIWPALRRGCTRLPGELVAAWSRLCDRALRSPPPGDAAAARALFEQELRPYRVQSPQGATEGLATGYFEPLVDASRVPRPGFTVPLYRPPADLARRRPYWTREQIDTLPAVRAALRGSELAWVASPLDALLLQIQGSGRLRLTEPDGREHTVRIGYAGSNAAPYRSVGAWLIEQGELKPGGANWPAIRDWAGRAAPARLNQMLWSNPRVVFFAEESVADPALGPRGAMGVPLTAGRSVAVDRDAVPLGTLLWLDTTEPLSAAPLRRLVAAQDSGAAIVGAVRIDYYWGSGEAAEQEAGRMKQPLRLWALWPR